MKTERITMRKPKIVRLLGVLVASICLASALAVTVGGPKPAGAEQGGTQATPEISFFDGAAVVPNVRPVIVVSGSDFDMGYQYYEQLYKIYGPTPLQQLIRPLSGVQIAGLRAYESLIQQQTPEFIDFMKGCTQAAVDVGVALSYDQVLAGFTGVKTFATAATSVSGNDTLPPSCSGWAAWGSATKDGGLICAGSTDGNSTSGGWSATPVIMFFPSSGNNFIVGNASLRGGTGVFHSCMNDKGVALVHHGGNYVGNQGYGFGPFGYGVPPYFATMHTLRFASDAIQAKNMQLAYTLTDRNNKGLWVDVKGNNFDIEAKDPSAIRSAGYMGEKNFIYATNNTMCRVLESFQEPDPDMGLYYIPHAGYLGETYHYYDPDAVTRNLYMWNMLHNYHGKIDLGFAKMMWRFTGQPPAYPTLEEAETYQDAGTLGKGWNCPIGDLSNGTVDVMVPDNGDQGLFYVNQGGVARGAHPLCRDYYYYIPDQTYTFYRLQLAASPQDAVDAAQYSAHHALYYADQALRKLTYTDVGYAPLKDIFDTADKEWISAAWYANLAGKATGNEAVCDWGKSLRSYTKCEAYANEVYESLVKPPNTPSDLGLKPWFSGWGDWATRGYPWDSKNPRDFLAKTIVPAKPGVLEKVAALAPVPKPGN